MGAVANDQDAADSIGAWGSSDQLTFCQSGEWVCNTPNPSGTAPNTPAEVLTYLGSAISSTSKSVTDKLPSGSYLGAVADGGHNPCED